MPKTQNHRTKTVIIVSNNKSSEQLKPTVGAIDDKASPKSDADGDMATVVTFFTFSISTMWGDEEYSECCQSILGQTDRCEKNRDRMSIVTQSRHQLHAFATFGKSNVIITTFFPNKPAIHALFGGVRRFTFFPISQCCGRSYLQKAFARPCNVATPTA
jgi:hypothetical protein